MNKMKKIHHPLRASHRGHRDPKITKRDEDPEPVQGSLKDLWEALVEKISLFIFSIRGFPYVPI